MGFVGGRLDLVTQRFVDAWLAFPGLLLLMTVMSILGTGALQVIIVLGLVYGMRLPGHIRRVNVLMGLFVPALVTPFGTAWRQR